MATQLAARTSGNPFYVTQLVLDAQTTRRPFDAAAVPDAVAQLVARRLDALAPDLRSTLALAAVAGVEFDLATLESCSSIEPERLLDIVEALCAPAIPRRARTGAIHLRARARARCRARDDHRRSPGALHRRLADALAAARRRPGRARAPLSCRRRERAREATRTLLDGGSRRAGAMPRGRSARDQFAIAADLAADIDDQCEPRSSVSAARNARSGHAREGRVDHRNRARHSPAPTSAAAPPRAATLALVGGGGRGVAVDLEDADRAALLRDALDGLDGDTTSISSLPCWLSSRSRSCSPTPKTNVTRSRSAVCAKPARERSRRPRRRTPGAPRRAHGARRHGCPGRRRTRDPGAPRPGRSRPSACWPRSSGWSKISSSSETAPVSTPRSDMPARSRTSSAIPTGRGRQRVGAGSSSIIDGRLDEAETLAFEALAHQAPAEHPEAVGRARREPRRHPPLPGPRRRNGRPAARRRRREPAHPHVPRGARAVLRRRGRSRPRARGLRAARGARLRAPARLQLVARHRSARRHRGDARRRRRRARARRLLEPYADRHVVLNCFGGGGAYWGPVAHHLGRLEAMLGRPTQARACSSARSTASEAMGAAPFADVRAHALASSTD